MVSAALSSKSRLHCLTGPCLRVLADLQAMSAWMLQVDDNRHTRTHIKAKFKFLAMETASDSIWKRLLILLPSMSQKCSVQLFLSRTPQHVSGAELT